MLPPVVDAPPATPLNTVEEENFTEGVSATRADDYAGVAWPPEDLADCFYVGAWELFITRSCGTVEILHS